MNSYVTVYKITNSINNKIYFGITRKPLNLRWNSHRYFSSKRNTPLYTAMRKYGLDKFSVEPVVYCGSWEYACDIEKKIISTFDSLYNLAPGGEGGFNVTDVVSWKQKLSKVRKKQNNKPFLGRRHSEETKEKCRLAAKFYWSRVRNNNPN